MFSLENNTPIHRIHGLIRPVNSFFAISNYASWRIPEFGNRRAFYNQSHLLSVSQQRPPLRVLYHVSFTPTPTASIIKDHSFHLLLSPTGSHEHPAAAAEGAARRPGDPAQHHRQGDLRDGAQGADAGEGRPGQGGE